MSFREKSAWVSFLLILVVFAIYFWNVGRVLMGTASSAGIFPLFLRLVIALVVAEVVLHVVLAVRDPKEARTPKDERERLIELKATRVAFYVLVTSAFLSIGWMHVSSSPWVMGHSVLFSIVVAELAGYGSQIVYFRRGA
jgi:hypothetical protein